MVDAEYENAFYKVLEILKYIDIDDYEKISPDLIKTFQTYANWDWNFEYDVNKTLNEQNISKITKAIIANIFKDYWATPHQKEKIEAKEKYERKKREIELQEKYTLDNLFRHRTSNIAQEKNEDINSNTSMVKFKELKWYKKLFDKIKNLFRKN